MCIRRILGLHCKTLVEVFDITGQPGVCAVHIVDSRQSHLLDQPVLQSLIGAFNTPFSLRAVSVNTFDSKLARRPRELRFSIRISIFGIDAEDTVLVAIKSHWHTVHQDMIVERMHIAQRSFGRHKTQLRQPPGGIVNEYQQRAIVAAPLKPIVGAAVYLDQPAKTALVDHALDARTQMRLFWGASSQL